MKRNKSFISLLITVLIAFIFLNICIAGESKAIFLKPEKGKTIENRKDFLVNTQIFDYDANANYWVAIATVKGHSSSWQGVLELRRELNNEAKKSQMLKLISKWEIDLVWPKYFIKKKVFAGQVYDGGNNPRRDPQPMILLILKVDSKLDNDINQWFDEGPEKGWPGMNFEKINNNLRVLARCEIFFP
ncbi:MAG: hypothetical protein JSV88_18765 [Candidatus Aminicenantes bacterium]|nr:MAG: hypothetical protein JSV88_18765 [Candidatus Aminicenantes bacterium]